MAKYGKRSRQGEEERMEGPRGKVQSIMATGTDGEGAIGKGKEGIGQRRSLLGHNCFIHWRTAAIGMTSGNLMEIMGKKAAKSVVLTVQSGQFGQ